MKKYWPTICLLNIRPWDVYLTPNSTLNFLNEDLKSEEVRELSKAMNLNPSSKLHPGSHRFTNCNLQRKLRHSGKLDFQYLAAKKKNLFLQLRAAGIYRSCCLSLGFSSLIWKSCLIRKPHEVSGKNSHQAPSGIRSTLYKNVLESGPPYGWLTNRTLSWKGFLCASLFPPFACLVTELEKTTGDKSGKPCRSGWLYSSNFLCSPPPRLLLGHSFYVLTAKIKTLLLPNLRSLY